MGRQGTASRAAHCAGVLGLLCALVLAACKDDDISGLVTAGDVTPECFEARPEPILGMGGPVPLYTWNDPSVIRVGGAYWMYASATDNFVFPVRIYRLVSADGVTWTLNPATPVLSEGAPGAWDDEGVETPAVVQFGGRYHLFYTGYGVSGDPGAFRVGHATSADGVNWSRAAVNPVVGPTGVPNDFRQYIVGEPGPVVVGSTLHVYFTAVGFNVPLNAALQVIGVTTSTDGNTWSTPAVVLEPDQGLYPRLIGGGPAGWYGYSTPNAAVVDGAVHLFFDVAYDATGADWKQVRLHHAVSPDGFGGWVQDATAIQAREELWWTAREVRSPDALLDGTELRLYFAGDSWDAPLPADREFGIGLATCALGG